MPILTLSHLSYTYEGERSPVFENLNYSFEEGRIYAVVGRSGAGKTTLLSLLSGLTRPTGGTSLDWTEKRTGEAVCAASPVRFSARIFSGIGARRVNPGLFRARKKHRKSSEITL